MDVASFFEGFYCCYVFGYVTACSVSKESEERAIGGKGVGKDGGQRGVHYMPY